MAPFPRSSLLDTSVFLHQFEEPCNVSSPQLILCRTPALPGLPEDPSIRVEFILDNLVFDFDKLSPTPFSYEADPILKPLNPEDPTAPFRHKPGSVFSVEVLLLLGWASRLVVQDSTVPVVESPG